MRIQAFQSYRPPPERAASVASLPYDVVDTREARALAEGNPDCFFHISRSEIDLPDGTDPYDNVVYQKARSNFEAFVRRGTLQPDPVPGFYIYRLKWGAHTQTGLVAGCHVADYASGLIRKHEQTRPAPENDRACHIRTVGAHTGLVLCAFRDRTEISRRLNQSTQRPPLYDFTASDGIRHTLWKEENSDWLGYFQEVPAVYIADGHHRAAAAARVARERRAACPGDTGEEAYNWFPAALFPASQLKILPYNRCVKDLNGLTIEQFLEAVRARFDVTPNASPEPARPGRLSMRLGERWYELTWPPPPLADPVAALDVSVLQDRLLGPVLGIDDPRNNPRIEFVGGIRGTTELEERVRSGRAAVAFSLYPTSIEQLMAVADRGLTLPPKSTWFEPKLRSGLLVHPLEML